MDSFYSFSNSMSGTSIGYLGIGLTYLFTAILLIRKKTPQDRRVAVSSFVITGLYIAILSMIITGNLQIRTDVDSSKILALLGIGAALICGAWLGRSESKHISRAMLGMGLAFSIWSLLLSLSPMQLLIVAFLIAIVIAVFITIKVMHEIIRGVSPTRTKQNVDSNTPPAGGSSAEWQSTETHFGNSTLLDYPIKSRTEDLLRRTPLAQKVASLVSEFKGDESFVIGIDGTWGSGKTSFINLILEELRNAANNTLIIEFNPWNFSGQNELIEDFFSSLTATIEGDKTGSHNIKEYAAKLISKSEFSFEPEISFWGIKVSAGKLRKFGGEKTLQESRKSVDNLLKDVGKKIVIVIDDTDRLDIEETKLIFKLIKMTANFPNTVFIVAYDREKVAEKITEKGLPGEDYLKKIVQVNFRLPQPDQQDLHRILFRDIDESIKDIDESKWNTNRWGNLFREGFSDFFRTIRDVKRYVSSLRLDFSIVGKNEVNPVDFLGIEAIRVFAPNIYTTIGDNKALFTETRSLYSGSKSEDDRAARIKEINVIIESYEDSSLGESLNKIIKELFPQVSGLYSNTQYGHDWVAEWRKNLQVASADIFGRYFQLSTPVGTVSEETMQVLMGTLSQADAFIDNLKKIDKDVKLRHILTRALDYISDLEENHKQNLIIALMIFGDTVKDERIGIFDLEDTDTLILRLIYNTLKSLPREKRASSTAKAIKETKSTFTAAHVVGILSRENTEYAEKKSALEPLFKEEDLVTLESLCIEQFKMAEEQGTLLSAKNLPHILFRWKEWGSEDEVKAFIKRSIESKGELVTLLSTFVSQVLSTAGNYNILSKKAMGQLYDIQEIERKVAEISNEDLEAMNDKEREAVELFRNPPKDSFD